jgi:hypothetical protein
MATSKKKPKRSGAAPCEACKGFTIPGRKVPNVARDRKGRFKRRPQQLGLF